MNTTGIGVWGSGNEITNSLSLVREAGFSDLPAERSGETVVEASEALVADHMHSHPHQTLLHLLLRLKVDLQIIHTRNNY